MDASRASGIPSGPPPIAVGSVALQANLPRTTFQHDAQGKLTEASTSRGAKVIYKLAYSYDDRGRLLEARGYGEDGRVGVRRVYRYAGDRNVPSSFAYFDGDGQVREEIAYSDYEFNSVGDWVNERRRAQAVRHECQ